MKNERSFMLFMPSFFWVTIIFFSASATSVTFKIGLILDFESTVGIVSNSCISMALDDFNAIPGHRNRFVLHRRNSNGSIAGAATAAMDLMENIKVQAIIGPQTSEQAELLVSMAGEAHIPFISFSAVSSLLSPTNVPYFVRIAQNDSSQARAIAAIVQAYRWKEVVLVHEDGYDGIGLIPYLTDTLQEIGAQVGQVHFVSHPMNKAKMQDLLMDLAAVRTKVFIVHLSFTTSRRLLLQAHKAGMMGDGYAWIVTSGFTNLLGHIHSSVLRSMQGVLGVKTHVPDSGTLEKFTGRWEQRFLKDHPEMEISGLDVYSLWAYDATWAVAMAAERTEFHLKKRSQGNRTVMHDNYLQSILETQFTGLSGEIRLVDGQLESSDFEIINVVGSGGRLIGYWTPQIGLSQSLSSKKYSAKMEDLAGVIWPGGSTTVPKGWILGRTLRIGVPVKNGFREFVKVERDSEKNTNIATGFSIDVFNAVMDRLPFQASYEFVPYENGKENSFEYYDELIYQVYLKKYDAVVGDTTIVANRSIYVDFTQPYAESGVSMIVLIENDDMTRSFWWFTKPMTMNLWVITIILFVANGTLVWHFESRNNNEDFLEPSNDQRFQTAWKKFSESVGKILFYSLSLFVFAQREKLQTNSSRLAVVVWTFLIFILVTSYTANLTSMLTVEKLRPSITDVESLAKRGDYVGYPNGSFVLELLKNMGFKEENLRPYATVEDYAEALSRGSSNNGVTAIIDEIPYIRVLLASYCHKYTMAGRTYRTGGFGFVFPKGFDMLPDINRAVLEFNEEEGMLNVEKKWFGQRTLCPEPLETPVTYNTFRIESFQCVYHIAGGASGLAILFFFIIQWGWLLWCFRAIADFSDLKGSSLKPNQGGESSYDHGTASKIPAPLQEEKGI